MSFSLDLTANQINQALNAAYSGLVDSGTGIVRLTGSQNISGDKTFYGAVKASGSFDATGVSRFLPPSNSSVDLGSASLRFKTGFVSGIDALTGYIRTLRVDNLIASVIPNLTNVTGNNLTISGQTNIQQATISGNASIGGNATITGALNVTGNTVLAGTVYSTGNKTFSGVLTQSGSLNVFGTESISGGLNVTGDIYCTGNALIKGNVSITGNHSQTGQFFLNSNNSEIIFTGNGGSHKFSVFGPIKLVGSITHNGDFSSSGDFNHTGLFVNTGSFTNHGNSTINGTSTVNGNQTVTGNIAASKVFASGITATGTASTPALILQKNTTTNPSGGAIEYNGNAYSLTTESTGSPTRSIINQTFSYIAPNNFVFNFTTGVNGCRFLNNTGIYLSTGTYKIETNLVIRKGTTIPAASFGISGSSTYQFNYRCGRVWIQDADDTTNATKTILITGNSSTNMFSGAFAAPTMPASYSLEAVITITGNNHKIFPFLHSNTANATGNTTGINFHMLVTQLSTGTGINTPSFNGPWSDA